MNSTHKFIFKYKYINILLIGSCVTLQSCNVGNNTSEHQATSKKPNNLQAVEKTLQAVEKTPGYLPLDRVELGWGYDPATNSVLPINLIEPSKLFAKDGSFEVITEASQYNDYSTYSQDISISTGQNSQTFDGGIGAGFGMYSGSLKAAYASAQSSSTGSLVINKAVGLAGTVRTHFPLDYKKLTDVEKVNVGYAIYQNAGDSFQNILNEVRNAPNDMARAMAILAFYQNYGTHFVSSVTKGYMGVINVQLKQTANQEISDKKGSVAGAFSSPFIKAEANYSQSSASAFEKSNWEYSAKTFTTPDDSNINTSLTNLMSTLTTEIAAQEGKLSFDKLKQAQSDLAREIKLPDLRDLNVNVDKSAQDQAKKNKALASLAENDLNSINKLRVGIVALVEKRDATVDVEQRKTITSSIKAQLEPNSNFVSKLKKFDLDSEYSTVILTLPQKAVLAQAQQLYDDLSFSIDSPSEDILNAQKLIQQAEESRNLAEQAAKERQNKIQAHKVSFQNWLEEVVFKSSQTGVSYKEWFDGLSLQQLQEYGVQFQKYLVKEGYAPAVPEVMLKSIHNHKQNTHKANLLKNDDTLLPATLDFDIVPWAIIYPELNSSSEFISGASDLIKIKILKNLNRIVDMRSYLLLCANNTNSATLNRVYTNDTISGFKAIINLVSSFDFASNKVKFKGANYDISDPQELSQLEARINETITNLSMVKDIPNWYKVTDKLLSSGLIAPQGIAIGAQRVDRPEFARILDANNKVAPVDMTSTIGQQLASIIGVTKNYNLFTGQLIVTDTSDLKQNYISNLQVIFSSGVKGSDENIWTGIATNWALSIIPDKNGVYQTLNVADTSIDFYDYPNFAWSIPGRSGYPIKLLIHPLTMYDTETLRTALGGEQKAKLMNPLFKIFYSGEGSANTDILYNMYKIRSY